MADIVSRDVRSRMMSGIRGKNTRPEIMVRQMLHAAGLRFRLHAAGLPGKPDIVLPRWRAVVQVNGCFWHGHDCHLYRLPATRTAFWEAKIAANRRRDGVVADQLAAAGWRQLAVWECALKGKSRLPTDKVAALVSEWVRGAEQSAVVRGTF
ncbi:very short patch repair endonuclease [Sphingomonas oligophenolica]|uniref:Very short patch repair endonuclease n=1 Tax=Sphingomonas oligophenolica TaxID=301154 RepID=A0A502BT76_9SPHN|nr:very short patch repair endonuclease [Sphingomonas oligophenolica]TPG04038.1 DNA mismatch endonuclease Vsr [Sphingomonas oligophenolica]